MPFNTDLAIEILTKLNGLPKKVGTIRAKELKIPFALFTTQLQAMEDSGLILPLSEPFPLPFDCIIGDEHTKILLAMTDVGEKYLKNELVVP